MSPDGSHIVCYHPEKLHPYEFTKPIDRNDPSMAQNDSIFNMQVQTDYNNRYYKKKLTKKDFRLETEKLAKMFNEHYATFRLTPRKDKIKNCSQFPTPPPDRAGI
ncbi:unnamed protein product [Didymodactylos carnosus]|uniref:Large ribosomal subunit protein mL42 n=1 Tax=Didymodactylos carnosus TaxID=1234261 RepID=A0A814ET58_9BILA|nr:unnamed protein product [Didymodactylos carnosus]CAF1250219.1 unnamed protein product [Didymodactylos carnosus]CAF3744677.1 unnamed protein product [Didymodactylos carnosus]CAF4057709.1 unnamed protein product [Didymodactylos carnosus]